MRTIYLVGYMGCGKTSVGRKLARRLGVRFVDTDSRIEEAEGASVADIFRYEGEEYFRTLERQTVETLATEEPGCVVSTGGGLPAWGDNMERLNTLGVTIYLHRSAERIVRRLTPYGRQKRPKLRGLTDEELVAFMTRDMAAREPYYTRAQWTLDGDSYSDDELIDRIVAEIGKP